MASIVEEALNTRESSVDNISMIMSKQKRPMRPTGSRFLMATGSIICW